MLGVVALLVLPVAALVEAVLVLVVDVDGTVVAALFDEAALVAAEVVGVVAGLVSFVVEAAAADEAAVVVLPVVVLPVVVLPVLLAALVVAVVAGLVLAVVLVVGVLILIALFFFVKDFTNKVQIN